MSLSPKEVKRAISKDLKSRRISHETAASLLGMGKQTFSNLLYLPKYFTRSMAVRFHDSFGYSVPFLISGEGDLLRGNTDIKISPTAAFGADSTYISILEDHIELSIDVLSTVNEYCENDEIKGILRALIARNIMLNQARKTLIFTKDKEGKEASHFDLLDSLFNVLGPLDHELKHKVWELKNGENK